MHIGKENGNSVRNAARAVSALLFLASCGADSGVRAISSTRAASTAQSIEVALARSYADQPVLVEECPESDSSLPQGSLVQADALGRNGAGLTYLIIGDASRKPVLIYDVDEDGAVDAWCGEVSDQLNKQTGLYEPSPDRTAPAYLVVPNWEGCEMPQPGQAFECTGSPLIWEPGAAQAPDITITPSPQTTIADA